jgi:hypothetical protein
MNLSLKLPSSPLKENAIKHNNRLNITIRDRLNQIIFITILILNQVGVVVPAIYTAIPFKDEDTNRFLIVVGIAC